MVSSKFSGKAIFLIHVSCSIYDYPTLELEGANSLALILGLSAARGILDILPRAAPIEMLLNHRLTHQFSPTLNTFAFCIIFASGHYHA